MAQERVVEAYMLSRNARGEDPVFPIGFEMHEIQTFMNSLARDPAWARASYARKDSRRCYAGPDVCVETRDVATARLEARFPDADVRVETTRVVPHDGFVVVHTTRHVLDEVASSATQYASVVGDVEIADFANGCTLVVQGVRDDAMRDKTWYNVRVRGSESNVTSVAMLTASKLRDAHKPSQS